MSADNWDRCPLCDSKKANALRKLKDMYGKVSQEEYEDFKEKLTEEQEDKDKYTDTPLREDYQLGVDSKGYGYVIYSGVCQRCGASWQFRKENILPEDKDDKELVEKINMKNTR